MQRRSFLKRSSMIGGSLLLSPLAKSSNLEKLVHDPNPTIEKVKNAMLCMQRASWEQGVAAQALLELGDQQKLLLMAYESVLRQTPEGRLSVLYTDNGVTDPAASGEAVLTAASITSDPILENAARDMLSYIMDQAPRAADGTIYHILSGPEMWIDSMYMCPPSLAAAGEYKAAVQQIRGLKKRLWNPADKLYSHRWHEEKKEFINSNYWGVGNGWVLAGISRVISKLPAHMSDEKEELIHHFREVLDAVLLHKRDDFLFHNNLNDTTSFVETNLSQMVAYSIYRAVSSGYLPADYLPTAHQMRLVCHAKVDTYGFVQDVCGAPHFNSPGRATEGQAFFLLMEAAHQDLLENL